MTRSHNIAGCEASLDAPDRRLAHFSHVHGAMAWGGPPRRRALRPLLTFAAGAILAAIAAAILLQRS